MVDFSELQAARDLIYLIYRSSRPEVFCKKVLLEIPQNSQENTCARVSFLIKLQASGEISTNTFSYRTPPVAGSGFNDSTYI